MEILQWTALFIISLGVLIKSANVFTDTAEKIGALLKISPFIIGVTIVAIGTSLPEIATSIISVIQGHSEIVIGNVVGSNIANILLVLGVTAIVGKQLFINKDILNIDLPILFGSTILLYLTTLDGKFTYIDSILTLAALIVYMVYNALSDRELTPKSKANISKMKKEEKVKQEKDHLYIKYPLLMILSAVFLYFSAEWTIKAVVELATIFKIGTEIIAISAVAVGTSLPELVVSVGAALRGKGDIAIGNITGSNIFNALGVMGIPAFFGKLEISPEIISFTIPALIFITLLYILVTMEKTVSRWEGMTLLIIFIAFMGKTFGLI